ncbi:MAG: hypothetical protein CL607_06260 [Anaerolineaceae bacterium]|nr:hypothetical protein [Anaerolineaceae bacterium]
MRFNLMPTNARTYSRWVWPILALALALRLLTLLGMDPLDMYLSDGGDRIWFLLTGLGLTSNKDLGQITLVVHGQVTMILPFLTGSLPTPPLYLYIIGWLQRLFGPEMGIVAIWLMQTLMGTAVCWFGYRVGRKLHSEAAGLITALALAVHPEFVREAANVLTESTYIFFIYAGIWLYVEYVAQAERPRWRMIALIGAVFGLATLTRAVPLLFPVGIGLHLLWISRGRWWHFALGLLVAYGLMIGTWTAHNLLLYDRFVIVTNQFTPALWRGAVTTDGAPDENDAQLAGTTPGEAAVEAITGDIGGYVAMRIKELGSSYLIPAGTTTLGGESLRALVLDWLREDRSLEGLGRVFSGDDFWLKSLMYLFHFGGIGLGLLGMILARRNWQIMTVLAGFILYTTLVHSVLIAIPRYIFPTQMAFWMLASVPLAMLWGWLRRRSSRV